MEVYNWDIPQKKQLNLNSPQIRFSVHLSNGMSFYGNFRKPFSFNVCGVYAIHMQLNDEMYVYIGQALDILSRVKYHIKQAGYEISKKDKVIIDVINAGGEICCVQLSDNCKDEAYYIDLHKMVGYNVLNIAKGRS